MNKLIQIVVLSAIAVYLFHGFRFDNIDISKFSFLWIVITFITMIVGDVALSMRWAKMTHLSLKVSLETIIVSSALNMILPARLGELSKALYLKKFYSYSYHKTFAVLFVERFFDLAVLFIFLCLWAYYYFVNDIVRYSIAGLIVFIVLVIALFRYKKILRLLKKIPFKRVRIYSQKIYKNINSLFTNPLLIFFYTLVVWIVYFITNLFFYKYVVHFGLNFQEITELFIFATIALAIPLAPAGIGTYEGAIVLFLSHHGVSKTDALVAAMIYHLLLFVMDFVLLYIFLLVKNIKFKELTK
jgi:glycosyltransferase 2 family protein